MASMAAKQAMDATLNHDRLSLQILLEDLTQHPAIINAIIYDVDNKPIVQAGITGNQILNNVRYFNAAIALHDTISGHVTLAINTAHPNSVRHTILLTLVTGLLAILAGLCLYRGTRQTEIVGGDLKNNSKRKEDEHAETILLTLDIANTSSLYRQLNSESRQQVIAQFNRHVEQALTLYEASLLYVGANSIVLSFKQSDAEEYDAAFNAICCAYIICALNKEPSNFLLSINAYVHARPEETVAAGASWLPWYNITSATALLAVEKSLFKSHEMASYLLVDTTEDYGCFMGIVGFQSSYATSINSQLNRLHGNNGRRQ